MKILVHSKVTEQEIESKLGLPEYSYYFAMREFLPCLGEIGEVTVIENPKQEVDAIYTKAKTSGQACVFLSFTPPHTTETELQCPTVCVFAWEFSKIPDECWEENDKNNWARVLEKLGSAITHSRYAESAMRLAVESDIEVTTIPSPVWDKFSQLRATGTPDTPVSIALEPGVDSKHFDFDKFDPLESAPARSIEYIQYAVSLISQRDQELEKRNAEFSHAETLVGERDEQLRKANLDREYSEAIVKERDQKLKELNAQLEEINAARDRAESIIQERDDQLAQRNKDCAYAESIVEERDQQLIEANNEREEVEATLARHKSTLLGKANAWLLRRNR